MSQDKRITLPASTGQSENVFNLYSYRPQFSVNTVIKEQKEGQSSQEVKNVYAGQVGNLYFPQLSQEPVHGASQQRQNSVSVQNVVKTEQSVTASSFLPGSLMSSAPMKQHHPRPAQTLQQCHDPSVLAMASSPGIGQSLQPVGAGLNQNISNISMPFSGSAQNSRSVTYHVGTNHPPSVIMSQAAQRVEAQSANVKSTNKWQTEQFKPYVSGTIVQRGGSTHRQATEMSVSASLPTSGHRLIQPGLLANPSYNQHSVSVGLMPHTQTQPLSNPAFTSSASTVQTFLQDARVTLASPQMQASLPSHSYSETGKRKSSGGEDLLQCDSKLSRTATRTAWDISSSNVSVPQTTSQVLTQLASYTNTTNSGGGWSGASISANSASGFIDSFRSFVESSSRGTYSHQNNTEESLSKPLMHANPLPTSSNRGDLSKFKVSEVEVSKNSNIPEEYPVCEGNFENAKKDPLQQQSQSFVEKMHATIFSLSEEVSSPATGTGSGGQQPSLTMSSSSLASILKRVGRLDGLQNANTDRPVQNLYNPSNKASECSSSMILDSATLAQNTYPVVSQMSNIKTSPSAPQWSHQSDGQNAVKSESTEEKMYVAGTTTADDLKQSSMENTGALSRQYSTEDSGDSASCASDSETETSSTNSKKRSKMSSVNTAPKKMKTENLEKGKAVPLSDTNPCVTGSRNKKQTKGTKQTAKGSAWDKPLVKVSLATLKRTGAPFLQNGPCTDLPPKVSKCRECRLAFTQGNKDIPSIFCRFYAFRRLKYNTTKGTVMKAGFSELSDADPDHIEPWLPKFPIEEPKLDRVMAKFILSKVGDKFCELVQQEREVKAQPGADATVVWKRAVTGVREMCDVCQTTIFNMHWVCSKCGYVVCLDCYKAKIKEEDDEGKEGEASRKWQICTSSRYPHDATKLILTQIIPSDALWELGRMIHDIRRKWSIPATCPCGQIGADVQSAGKTDNSQTSVKKMINGVGGGAAGKSKTAAAQQLLKSDPDAQGGAAKGLPQQSGVKKEESGGAGVKQDGSQGGSQRVGGCTSLRELLTKTAGKGKVSLEKKAKPKPMGSSLNDIIQSVVEKSCRDLDTPTHAFKFLHYIPRLGQWTRELPIVAHSLTETSVLYPDVPHSWLCDGRLLRLHEPHHKGNLRIFQEQWKRGQPVMVSCVHKLMKHGQWKPESFSQQFGHKENDLVNCHTGDIIADRPMRDFWDGFESSENRLVDEEGRDMMLKLKDWPPGDDFAELLPSHFDDLMAALPLPEYTRRDGKLNLASRLPDFLVRPDLGPKMYNAFGSAMFSKEGTTNLHLDISDAVNVLVYVGVPADGPRGKKEHEEAAVKAIDEAGCDSITKRRVREVHELPGALWQIYDAHDADKMRDFLNKVAKERGEEIEPNHDAIHDQSWYLDEELRDRLLKEYGVQGYTIVQCLGDSIFIPAGAPHQVRNLHSCIKVAEDFVSPEHLNHCFRLTQEFRQLSETHSNHEDKLQVKNIIYHAVKDSIAVLRELEPEDDD